MDADRSRVDGVVDEGGDAACWAHLVCEACGRVTEPGAPHECEGADDAPAPSDS